MENLPLPDVPDEQEEDETEDISSDDSSIPDQGEVTPAEDESYDDESDEDERADIDDTPIEGIEEEPVDNQTEEDTRTAIERAIDDRGYAYVVSECSASVYEDPFLSEDSLFFTTDDDYFIMLATGYNDVGSIRVSFLTTDGEVLTGYIAVSDLWEEVPTGRDLVSAAGFAVEDIVTPVGVMTMYWLIGTKVTHPADDPQDTPWVAQPGDFIAVTPDTRAFVCVDETLDPENDYDGDNFAGYFINEAILQVDTMTCIPSRPYMPLRAY